MIDRFTLTHPESSLLVPGTFEFGPGANILFGPNGSGKSTLLRGIAIGVGAGEGGWPVPNRYCSEPLPDGFYRDRGEWNRGEPVWDGLPLYYFDARQYAGIAPSFDGRGDLEGIDQVVGSMFGSSGQKTLMLLHKLLPMLRSMPDFLTTVTDRIKKDQEYQEKNPNRSGPRSHDLAFVEYVKACSKANARRPAMTSTSAEGLQKELRDSLRYTILMDEPDEHLDFRNVRDIFHVLIPNMVAQGWQVIIATHNPLALGTPDAKIFEIGKAGYIKDYMDTMRDLVTKFPKPPEPREQPNLKQLDKIRKPKKK